MVQVTVQVTIPQRLSKEERKLVEELAALGSTAPKGSGKKGGSLWAKAAWVCRQLRGIRTGSGNGSGEDLGMDQF
eukprot:2515901-Pyramimonas_sp.AAC.2